MLSRMWIYNDEMTTSVTANLWSPSPVYPLTTASLRRRIIDITFKKTRQSFEIMDAASTTTVKASSLRWQILRQALLRHPPPLIPEKEEEEEEEEEHRSETHIKRISRKASPGFNLIPHHVVEEDYVGASASGSLKSSGHAREIRVCYTLPVDGAPRLFITQRVDEYADLSDFEICNKYNVDNTGLVCHWPSEDILAYFCLSHADMFSCKRVIELGSGYGLAGLAIAAISVASEVVITDGNPQVVDYIQRNIDANSGAFGATRVNCMTLHWDQEEISNISNAFDVIIASDCTFFKEFHNGLARIIKLLLKKAGPSEAFFFSPKRGNSLEKFLETIKQNGLCFSVTEIYDTEVWDRHLAFMGGKESWPSYEKDHCYPLMVRITI